MNKVDIHESVKEFNQDKAYWASYEPVVVPLWFRVLNKVWKAFGVYLAMSAIVALIAFGFVYFLGTILN